MHVNHTSFRNNWGKAAISNTSSVCGDKDEADTAEPLWQRVEWEISAVSLFINMKPDDLRKDASRSPESRDYLQTLSDRNPATLLNCGKPEQHWSEFCQPTQIRY